MTPLLLVALALASEAERRIDPGRLGDLFYSATSGCDALPDLARRQCRLLRAARARAWAGATYVVRADATALSDVAGQVAVRGCLACKEPVQVGGEELYVVTRGSLGEEGGTLVGPEIVRIPGPKGPGIDLVFRLPSPPEAWTLGHRRGFFVELVAWRPVEPASKVAAPAKPSLPESLTADQIKTVMTGVGKEVDLCFESLGVPGDADLHFEVGGDGTVRAAEVRGELADTPTARCITDAVKKAVFPPFRKPSMWIHYPFILR